MRDELTIRQGLPVVLYEMRTFAFTILSTSTGLATISVNQLLKSSVLSFVKRILPRYGFSSCLIGRIANSLFTDANDIRNKLLCCRSLLHVVEVFLVSHGYDVWLLNENSRSVQSMASDEHGLRACCAFVYNLFVSPSVMAPRCKMRSNASRV